ncbi:MAG: hypothetical protein AAF297_05080 [Planctomycetota bacterium]
MKLRTNTPRTPRTPSVRSRRSVIGLDLGTSTVKAAQATASRSGVRWSTAIIPRDEPGAPYSVQEFRRIAGALRRVGLRGSKVALVAPRDIVRISTVDLPAGQPEALRTATARAELGEMHGLDPASFEIITWLSPLPPRATPIDRLLAVLCPHDSANALLDAAEGGGLDPVSLVPAALAIAKATPDPRLTCVLDLGWSGASLTTVRDGRPLFDRPLGGTSLARLCTQPIGSATLDPAAASWIIGTGRSDHPGVSRAVGPVLTRYTEAVAAELRASMNYITQCLPGERPEFVLATGGPAADTDLLDLIVAQSGAAVRPWSGQGDAHHGALARGAARFETASMHRLANFNPDVDLGAEQAGRAA